MFYIYIFRLCFYPFLFFFCRRHPSSCTRIAYRTHLASHSHRRHRSSLSAALRDPRSTHFITMIVVIFLLSLLFIVVEIFLNFKFRSPAAQVELIYLFITCVRVGDTGLLIRQRVWVFCFTPSIRKKKYLNVENNGTNGK